MIMRSCATTVAGPRHIATGEPNQDACLIAGWRGGWIVAVADGLGSRPLSAIGSREACRAARRNLRNGLSSENVGSLLAGVHQDWIQAVSPRTADEVATTLIIGRIDRLGRGFIAQIGDGFALVRESGKFRCLTPPRAGFGNQTDALTADHRPDRWNSNTVKLTEPGDGIVLMTDGVGDDIEPDRLPDFLDALYGNVSRRSRRRGRRWLATELTDWATPMHSDDKSIAAVFRVQR
jgi:hypothetical protein